MALVKKLVRSEDWRIGEQGHESNPVAVKGKLPAKERDNFFAGKPIKQKIL